jgi:ATP-dependent Clp protease protease subunit
MVKHLTVVKNEAKKEATIRLYGVIGDFWFSDGDPLTAQQFQREITALEKDFDTINVRINSPGGSVWDGLAIANAIKASRKDIHTYNDGLAASMAAVILAAAKDGNRHAAKGSITMLHSASTIAWGNANGMRETADMLETHDEVLAGFFADASGKSIGDIKAAYFDGKDHYLTAQEAQAEGFLIAEDYASDALPENITDMSHQQIAALYQPAATADQEPSPSFMAKIEAKIQSLINPKNTEMKFTKLDAKIQSLINPKNTEMKFTKLEALAKLGAQNVTEELVNAVKTELAEAEIEGVSIVLDSVLEKNTTDLADANLLVQQGVSDLADKDALIADLQAKLAAPADEGGNPAGAGGNEIPGGGQEPVYNKTSVDLEKERLSATWTK